MTIFRVLFVLPCLGLIEVGFLVTFALRVSFKGFIIYYDIFIFWDFLPAAQRLGLTEMWVQTTFVLFAMLTLFSLLKG